MPAAIYDFPALAKEARLLDGADVAQPMAVKVEAVVRLSPTEMFGHLLANLQEPIEDCYNPPVPSTLWADWAPTVGETVVINGEEHEVTEITVGENYYAYDFDGA